MGCYRLIEKERERERGESHYVGSLPLAQLKSLGYDNYISAIFRTANYAVLARLLG